MHLLSSTAFHGAESMTLQLAVAQRNAGHEVCVGLLDAGDVARQDIESRFSAAGIRTRRLECRGKLDLGLIRELGNLIGSRVVDILHSHKYKATFHALPAARGRVPVVTTYHNWILTDRNLRMYARIDKRLARWCAACVAVSAEVRAELERYVPAGRVHQVANGIDLDRWVAPVDASAREAQGLGDVPAIGFVGRLSQEKGLGLLVDALALMPPVNGRPVHALLAGDGPDRNQLESQVRARGLAGRVHFAGNVSDTRAIYGAVDLVVLPSLTEGLPMTVLEAMACERPVIATAVGELPSVIEEGRSGWLLPARDARVFAQMLTNALSDKARLREMGAAARRRIRETHSAAAMAAAYAQIYRGALDASPG